MRRSRSLPASVYALVDKTPGVVLLEGAAQDNGRESHRADSHRDEPPWTRLFTAPLRAHAAYRPDEIPPLFAEIEEAVAAGLCAAGFFSYECGAAFEPAARMRAPRAGTPLAWFGIYERAYVFDHECGEFTGGSPPQLDEFRSREEAPISQALLASELSLSEPEYARRAAAVQEFIHAGDVYQLNLTAPFRVSAAGSAAQLYARLRARQPAAYGAFVHWEPERRVLSFSPELFFRIDHEGRDGETRRIVTRPMKGTAPRGRTTREDQAAAEWLRNDAKNRSENLMIVDLVRNDLGRVARFGTVRAENLFAVERLPSLWQMTSTIRAELRGGVGFEDVFRALFPCGSITGAPKVRAMQLVAELEEASRGVYTGAIGFFSPRKTVFNVAIRTLELNETQGVVGVGSGIVADSDPAAEYRECLLKADFLLPSARPAREEFSLIETLLWEDGYPLLELHLNRLEDSAAYFDFSCDRRKVKAALEARAAGFASGASHRVRLLLDSHGGLHIGYERLTGPVREALIAGKPAVTSPGRVRLSAERTDPADAMLFHKTTRRPLYARCFAEAQQAGLDDVLFLNARGEVTEGAISNVFLEKDGRWFTPPVDCGLLPGVCRRYLLAIRQEIEERVLPEADLRAADGIYIANAVRGLRAVVLED